MNVQTFTNVYSEDISSNTSEQYYGGNTIDSYSIDSVFSSGSSTFYKMSVNCLVKSFNNKETTISESYKNRIDRYMNVYKIDRIEKFEYGWNGYSADPIDIGVLQTVRKYAEKLTRIPEIFPTACGTIQFEYDGDNNSYIEFEIGASDFIEVFLIDKKGESRKYQIKNDLESVEKEVKTFYA